MGFMLGFLYVAANNVYAYVSIEKYLDLLQICNLLTHFNMNAYSIRIAALTL